MLAMICAVMPLVTCDCSVASQVEGGR
jgi:hypothetical protein